MHICDLHYSDNSTVSPPQYLIAALQWRSDSSANPEAGSVYVYDLDHQCLRSASCSVATMLGYTPEAIDAMGSAELIDLIHPHDLAALVLHHQRFATLQAGEVITINYRLQRADGTWCWLHSQETPFVMATDGLPLHIMGTIQDIGQSPHHQPSRLLARQLLKRRRTQPGQPLLSQLDRLTQIPIYQRQSPVPQ